MFILTLPSPSEPQPAFFTSSWVKSSKALIHLPLCFHLQKNMNLGLSSYIYSIFGFYRLPQTLIACPTTVRTRFSARPPADCCQAAKGAQVIFLLFPPSSLISGRSGDKAWLHWFVPLDKPVELDFRPNRARRRRNYFSNEICFLVLSDFDYNTAGAQHAGAP